MVLDEDVTRLLYFSFGNQPAWRLGAEEDEEKLVGGWDDLDQSWKSPGPLTFDSVASVGSPGSNDISKYNRGVVKGRDSVMMLLAFSLAKICKRD